MQEIWKDVVGYEGSYQISNLGRLKSTFNGRGTRLLRNQITNSGYYSHLLYKDSKCKIKLIHRLVAEAFIPNPLNLPEVNHKDENKLNNNVDNLEWCDHTYNVNYGTANQRMRKTKGKRVSQFTLDGEFVAQYDSIIGVERLFGYDHSTICKCCTGKYKQYKGFIWKYS